LSDQCFTQRTIFQEQEDNGRRLKYIRLKYITDISLIN